MPDPQETAVAERLARIEAGLQTLLSQVSHIPRLSETLALMQERDSHHNKRIDMLFVKASDASAAIKIVDAKVDRWVNRGIGFYAAATVLVVVIGALLFRVIGNYEGIIKSSAEMIVTIDRRLAWVEFEQKGRVAGAKREGNDGIR